LAFGPQRGHSFKEDTHENDALHAGHLLDRRGCRLLNPLLRAGEGRRTRAAFGRSLDTDVPVDDTQNVIAKKLESIQSQLAALSRRMTVLEESIAARPQVADNTARLQTDLTATRQEVKAIASSQARLSGVPGYLADLTRYLDRSFAHIENRVADSGTPEALLLAVDDLTQRLNVIEELVATLNATLGVLPDTQDGAQTTILSLDTRLSQLAEQNENIRKDIVALREWMTPRNIDPVKRPR